MHQKYHHAHVYEHTIGRRLCITELEKELFKHRFGNICVVVLFKNKMFFFSRENISIKYTIYYVHSKHVNMYVRVYV